MTPATGTYSITKNATGLLIVFFGRWLLIYPFWRFDKPKWFYRRWSDGIRTLHLGLIGFNWGRAK